MMDVREKLIDILRKPIFPHELVDPIEAVADYLIDNCVTVQEWISVKDRLPEDMVDVLTCDAKGNIHIMWHHHEYQYPFNIGRNDIRYFPVTHWCYLPQPPKGE